MHVLKKVKWMA